MTAQVLSLELSNLIQESKRKNTELRNAAEKSLQDLKSLHSTSEEQLSADLVRRPQFINPFLIACGTKTSKFINSAVICLQRLSVSQGLPKERLREVLEAFSECTSQGLEVQLKILQALPSLLQNYSDELKGDLLRTILQVCSSLQAAKNPAVSGTAVATLQQLVSSVFDKVASEDEKRLEAPTVAEAPGDDGPVRVHAAANDAYKVFHDLCAIAEGSQPKFVRIGLSQGSGLELVESVLSNHQAIFATHPEQSHLLKSLLMPLLIRYLSEKLPFPVTVRVFRILQILIRDHLPILSSECETALKILNNQLDPDVAPGWKRAMVMEIFRGIYAEPALALSIFAGYDEVEGKSHIVRDNLSIFVRLSTEKPAVIGLGHQSTAPSAHFNSNDPPTADQAAMEAGAGAGLGIITGPSTTTTPTSATGIGQWSNMRTPCMDHLDKAEAPPLPDTYVYSLVLSCITNLSDGLAKFILPLTVHNESKSKRRNKLEAQEQSAEGQNQDSSTTPGKLGRRISRTQSFRKKTVPQNPLTLEKHKTYPYIKSTAALINECWPAVLATCSTFLNSSLEADFYRGLVRSIQKFTQVAGLLRLSTPRDAFLTTLGKSAVPSQVLAGTVTSPQATPKEQQGMFSNAKGLLSVESLVSPTASLSFDKTRRVSADHAPSLSPRNLLCLRALLNLAIALGPTLNKAWSIIFETLQQADIVLAASSGRNAPRDSRGNLIPQRSDGDTAFDISNEVTAVQAAASRLFESTVDFPNEAFVSVLQALCGLLHGTPFPGSTAPSSSMPGVRPLHQRRIGSISGPVSNTDFDAQDYIMALGKMGDVVALNLSRLTQYGADDSGWSILVDELTSVFSNRTIPTPARRMAADILSQIGKDITKLSMSEESETAPDVQETVLNAIRKGIDALYRGIRKDDTIEEGAVDIHGILLDSLKSVLEQCGDSVTAGWSSVFSILSSVFRIEGEGDEVDEHSANENDQKYKSIVHPSQTISRRLARSAFESVQLVCSDFLAAIPNTLLSTLLNLILRFSSQQEDLNISLSTITFFWNVSDFLPTRSSEISFEDLPTTESGRPVIAKHIKVLASEGSISALWLLVLLHLTTLSTDGRPDVRNGSIQTISRIFDNFGEQLSPNSWFLCMHSVLFELIGLNLHVQQDLRSPGSSSDVENLKGWNNTSKMILETTSGLFSSYASSIRQHQRYEELWEAFAGFQKGYLSCQSNALNTSVYASISDILSKFDSGELLGLAAVERMLTVWLKHFPVETTAADVSQTNQDAFLSYVRALKDIYRLLKPNVKPVTAKEILNNLKRAVAESDAAAYSADIEYATELQKQVMECLNVFSNDIAIIIPELIILLADLIVLPLNPAPTDGSKKRPTFVALSKLAMGLAQDTVPKHVSSKEMYTSGALHAILRSLAISIDQKNSWRSSSKPSTVWRPATTAAVIILKAVLPQLHQHSLDKNIIAPIWDGVVTITDRVAHTNVVGVPATVPLADHEDFDVQSLGSLRDAMTPLLGSPTVTDSARRIYVLSLFHSSLIHATEAGEIPDTDKSPLQGLFDVRLGRTYDPSPNPRSKMAYFCLSEMGSLVSSHDGSIERVKLAQAAAPYLILRAALTLKAYIADQPLRGRMPQPYSQRRELMFVLNLIKDLESEPKAIPDAPGVSSQHRKHLHRLYPLLTKAGRVCKNDEKVLQEIMSVMDVIGEEFGL